MSEVSLVKVPWTTNGHSRAFHGAAAEYAAVSRLMEAGYDVYLPPYPAPYDLIAQFGDRFFKVEVKSMSNYEGRSYAPPIPWPKRNQTSWDLLIIVSDELDVFCFDSETTFEEARDKIRAHYGFPAVNEGQVSVRKREVRNREIHDLFWQGKSPEELADQFGLSVRTIQDIVRT